MVLRASWQQVVLLTMLWGLLASRHWALSSLRLNDV